VVDDEFPGFLPGDDACILAGRVPHSADWSSLKRNIAILALLSSLWAIPAFSQGCAMCYSSASGTTQQGKQALSRAVLILLIPPVGLMTFGMAVAYRYGKKRDQEDSDGEV